MHGRLSFIERALGIEQARELYEQETGQPVTQVELARHLTQDGYPISQQHISRMQEAVRYLLPAIPRLLFSGLGKPQIERLSALRKAASRTWERHARRMSLARDFNDLFLEILAPFDEFPANFKIQRVEDEIIRNLSATLGMKRDDIALELMGGDAEPLPKSPKIGASAPKRASERQCSVSREPAQVLPQRHAFTATESNEGLIANVHSARGPTQAPHASVGLNILPQEDESLTASDLWYIAPELDAPDHLRVRISINWRRKSLVRATS